MANSLTYLGEENMLKEAGSSGGIAAVATHLRLYDNTSTPAKAGTLFTEVTGGAYAAKTIVTGDWTYDQASSKITLDDQIWTAVATPIANIAGAYITDTSGDVLAWWERSVLTLAAGETLTADDLYIALA